MICIFSSPPFYSIYVQLPVAGDPVPAHICNNPKFWPYFQHALGALDGSHISCAPPSSIRGFFCNRKGFISQNCLFACTFALQFVYSLHGYEGSASASGKTLLAQECHKTKHISQGFLGTLKSLLRYSKNPKLRRFSRSNMGSIWIQSVFSMQKQSERMRQYWPSYSRNSYFTAAGRGYESKLHHFQCSNM